MDAILITGAGRGLGYQLAKGAVERGRKVVACVRNVDEASDDLQALAARFVGSVRIERLDVTNEVDAAALAEKLKGESAKLGGLINNAGVLLGREHGIASLPIGEVRTTYEVNVFGPMIVAKHLTPLLADHAGTAVLNVSSEAGSFAGAYGGDYPYAASKTALNMFSKQLKAELAPRGIRVLAVHPGWIRTDMGGGGAPREASESAAGILDLALGLTKIGPDTFFVDDRGKPMPL